MLPSFFYLFAVTFWNNQVQNHNLVSNYAESFKLSCRSVVYANRHVTGKIPVLFLVYWDEARHPSPTKPCIYRRETPARSIVRSWHKKLMEARSMRQRKKGSRPHILEEVGSVRAAYTRSPRKCIRRTSTQLQTSRSTIHKVLHKICEFVLIKFCYYRRLKPLDTPWRKEFAIGIWTG